MTQVISNNSENYNISSPIKNTLGSGGEVPSTDFNSGTGISNPNYQKITQTLPKANFENEQTIMEVWAGNFHQEIRKISQLIDKYPYISTDTEFPGIIHSLNLKVKESAYKLIKQNVDDLKLIQFGITLSDEHGNPPPGEVHTWQFNMNFDVKSDKHSGESINLLTNCGIGFDKLVEYGITPEEFGSGITTSGLVLNEDVKWVTFHGSYDLAYLIKLLTNLSLPESEVGFFDLLKIYFPTFYDIKHLTRNLEGFSKSLQKLSMELDISRLGTQHQAGSDSHVTSKVFHKITSLYISIETLKADENMLFGLGHYYEDETNSIFDSTHMVSQLNIGGGMNNMNTVNNMNNLNTMNNMGTNSMNPNLMPSGQYGMSSGVGGCSGGVTPNVGVGMNNMTGGDMMNSNSNNLLNMNNLQGVNMNMNKHFVGGNSNIPHGGYGGNNTHQGGQYDQMNNFYNPGVGVGKYNYQGMNPNYYRGNNVNYNAYSNYSQGGYGMNFNHQGYGMPNEYMMQQQQGMNTGNMYNPGMSSGVNNNMMNNNNNMMMHGGVGNNPNANNLGGIHHQNSNMDNSSVNMSNKNSQILNNNSINK
jgi:CCR4-NOT transcription complex subunit 7/8